MIPRILPFALFMAFIGLEELLEFLAGNGTLPIGPGQLLYVYPLKALAVACLLLYFWKGYTELRFGDLLRFKHTAASLAAGVAVFLLWINMDWAILGESAGYDPTLVDDATVRGVLTGFRLFGAVLVVPVMEELFWRSFLMRYVISDDFQKVAVGTFTWPSLLIVAALFASAHHLLIAGFMAGVAYALLLYLTRSIAQCVLAHGLTNLLLGLYVLETGSWSFW
ncbi:CAAX prenyl protease-related protein [Desulfohalovibrio reitneri]|uniref:CAAX prenyl protease-related protein n=1 Tax=Desulfohalovibrio reitneri TaxID=1307759 RepID=UPI000ACB305A|nr:CAAX prenyl protease-related protein [Desulfohalovibrio reitneri]